MSNSNSLPMSLDKPFPSKTELKSPAVWDRIIASVTTSGARRHSSLSKEMVWVFGLTSHHNNHRDDFSTFCASRNITPPKAITPASILQTVLLEYTGTDPSGKKNASKYKRLLLPSLTKGLSVERFERRLKSAGGVFGLAPEARAKRKMQGSSTKAAAEVDEDGDYWVSVPFGETQTVVLKALHGPTTSFTLSVTSESVRHGPSPFSRAIELLPLDDEDDEVDSGE